jgi:glycosylphosphatidylinositol transamidase
MPNLDFLNVLVEIARYEGVPIQLHSKYFDAIPFQQHGYRFYDLMNSARNLLTMMFNQASGLPSGLHGLFLKYRIDALTLYGVHGPSSVRLGVWQTAMVVESMFRSLNNLLERFHQSFFYYLLPATYRYISIGMYYPALGLIVAGMLLMVRVVICCISVIIIIIIKFKYYICQ